MWRRVDLVWTDVSEERIASIFRVEKSASEEPAWAGGCSDLIGNRVRDLPAFSIVPQPTTLPRALAYAVYEH
jgi:hypothetical protein